MHKHFQKLATLQVSSRNEFHDQYDCSFKHYYLLWGIQSKHLKVKSKALFFSHDQLRSSFGHDSTEIESIIKFVRN